MWAVSFPCCSVGTTTNRNLLSLLNVRSVANALPVGFELTLALPGSSVSESELTLSRATAPVPEPGMLSERLLVTNAYRPSLVTTVQQAPRPAVEMVPLSSTRPEFGTSYDDAVPVNWAGSPGFGGLP